MTGVKAVRNDVSVQYVDVGREFVVQLAHERLGREHRAHVDMRRLRDRMDARRRPCGAVQLEILASGHDANRTVDFALDGSRVLLNLPAAVPRSGVFDGELEARHGVIVGSQPVNRASATTSTIAGMSSAVVSLVPSL